MSDVFPLSAIVGQQELIDALLINAVAPEVGGVLVRGERGTAKTTAVRGLAPLLPGPAPLVELPLGATLDRLVGSLDLARALDGEHRYEAGLIVKAHQGILYVDEVNLLADHLVDALLDAAATGVARVEREAVSVTREARFLLVGTMNPEEGELRPQLLDRFGLGVEVRTPSDPAERAEIVRRRLAFEADPDRFAARWAPADAALKQRLTEARSVLPRVLLPERELQRITGACAKLGVDGVRGDIVTARAARALAALAGVTEVGEDHVRRAAALALAHRRRRDPLDGHAPDDQQLQDALDSDGPEDPPPSAPPPPAGDPPQDGSPAPPPGLAPERIDSPLGATLPPGTLTLRSVGEGPGGRRARSHGAAAGSIDSRAAARDSDDVAIVASLHARLLGTDQLREHVRAGSEGALLCLVLDASGSMGARRRAARVKGALLELLRDAYARRDRIAVIAFRDARAELLVAPGMPLERAAALIRELPTGGRTPLADGLEAAVRVIRRERVRDPRRRAIAALITDGRVSDPDGRITRAAAALGRTAELVEVIDTEDGPVRIGLASVIAAAAGGRVHQLVRKAA
ncbi:MAG TPA: VWA domain-containing protein [Solirubrobacteraceae bacterium]|nr:VWA domain-containing protein [Solirubrobacteraceae bacterium]